MKSFLKLALRPSLLATSMALSACSGNSTTNDTQVGEQTTDATDKSVQTEQIAETASTVDKMSAEEQMIDNLVRYRWTLATAADSNNQPLTSLLDIKDQVTLNFNHRQGQNTVSYSVGCNMMSAAYQLQGHTMLIDGSMSTKMLCEDLNQAEDELNKLMQGESQLSLAESTPPMLTQVINEAATLVWQGVLTPQAKYNTKGKTIFWAVSSETKPCGSDDTQSCLQVKPITYDDQGIKTSEGEWTEFVGTIDGYQHDAEHDQVLRLQRYKLDSSNAVVEGSAGEYAYVLDTVIESAVAE